MRSCVRTQPAQPSPALVTPPTLPVSRLLSGPEEERRSWGNMVGLATGQTGHAVTLTMSVYISIALIKQLMASGERKRKAGRRNEKVKSFQQRPRRGGRCRAALGGARATLLSREGR